MNLGEIPLSLTLELRTDACVRGESVFFKAKLLNAGKQPIPGLKTFEEENEALVLRAVRPEDLRRRPGAEPDPLERPGKSGTALSFIERDGIHEHGADEPEKEKLEPGAAFETEGDVLRWLGELDPGSYELSLEYMGPLGRLVSPPAKLAVEPAKPVANVVSRPGRGTADAPTATAWVHSAGAEQVIFYELGSPHFPKNPWLGARVAGVKSVGELAVATLPAPETPKGHVLWLDKNQLFMGVVDLKTGLCAAGLTKAVPLARMLESPLSARDGSAWVVMADAKGAQLSLLHVAPTGAVDAYPLDLGAAVPVGPYSCCWAGTGRLHLFWATPGSRRVHRTIVRLDDPGGEKATPEPYLTSGNVLWIHGHLDLGGALAEKPLFEHETRPEDTKMGEPPRPLEVFWAVVEGKDRLAVHRVNATHSQSSLEATIDASKNPGLRVVASTRFGKKDLYLLLADAAGRLFGSETKTGTLVPLEERVGGPVSLTQQPGLLSAPEVGAMPWVYTWFMDPGKGRMAREKLEPADASEPIDPR